MKLGYNLYYVDDVEETLEFYQSAFGVSRRFFNMEGEQAYGELETGATVLGFVSHPLARSHGLDYADARREGPAPPVEIGFVTENVEAAFAKAIAAGAIEVVKPTVKPWGQTVAYVRENNGFLVTINTPITPPAAES